MIAAAAWDAAALAIRGAGVAVVAAHRWRGRRWSALAAQAAVVHGQCWSGAVRSRAGGVRAAVAKAARGSATAACRRALEWRRLRRQAAARDRGQAAAA